jgi:hypothetical protein
MKHTRKYYFLLALVLLASVALAQTRDSLEADKISAEDSISAARSKYAQTSNSSPDADNPTLAQVPRRRPARPFPARRGYPRGTYQTPWMEHGNPGHALIGAGIGIGVGAALGAVSNANKGAPVGAGAIVGGALFGCIGGAIGAAHGGPHMFAHRGRVYRPSWPDDDEESHLRFPSKDSHAEQSVLARPASPSQPTGVEAMAPSSSGTRTVPGNL